MTDETLFAEALEKATPAERAEYLDAACGSAEQRARVESLLAAHDRAGAFLGRPAVGDGGSGDTTRATPDDGGTHTFDPDDHPADETDLSFLAPPSRPDSLGRIGQYDVLEVLGRGGFGIVFRAFDDRLQRVVAVKVLAPHLAVTSPARKRFLREARSAAAVRHENVVQIHAVEEQPLPHLVMEYIPGATLQDRLDRTGPLDPTEALRIGRQIADGLAAAHAQGLIHRDIKPSNILIDAGPNATAKITDFGLARAADDASLTRSGAVAGTPMYMAPEQARGETLDHRADLFSLGSVLYVMLSGRPPFRANSTLAVLKRVADDTPRPIREIIPEVPEWLCRIVEKLHAKDPAERFQTAREVADLLADCEKQLTERKELTDLSRIPGGRPTAKRKRLPAWVWVLIAVAGLVVAGAGVVPVLLMTLWLRPTTTPDEDRAQLSLNWEGTDLLVTVHGESGLEYVNRERSKGAGMMLKPGTYTVRAKRGERVVFERLVTLAPQGHLSVDIPADPPADEGFVSLFDGKTLAGWKPHPDNQAEWVVEDGSLTARGGVGYLATTRADYRDFHLRAEVKINNQGDSGIVFRHKPGGGLTQEGARHYEADIIGGSLGHLYTRRGGRELNKLSSNEITWAQSWVVYEVIASGGRVTVKMDGRVMIDATEADPILTAGHIILESATPETSVRFRKIEIKELPAGSPPVPKRTADFLPFVRGTWTRDGEIVEPKALAARVGGQLAFDTVAGGKVMRGLTVDENATPTSLILHTYAPDGDKLSSWYFGPDGTATATDAGVYEPTTRLFTWLEPLPDGGQSVHNMTVVDGNTVQARHHDTDATGKFVFQARGTFTRSTLPPVVPKVDIDPKRPDEMKVLDRLTGDWRTQITIGSNGRSPGPTSWRTIARPTLGGRFVELTGTRDDGGGGDYAVVWYDPAVKKYRQWYFNGDGYTLNLFGTWDAATSTLAWETADKTKSGHWTFKGDEWQFQRPITDGNGRVHAVAIGVSRPTGSPADAARIKGEWVVTAATLNGKPVADAKEDMSFRFGDGSFEMATGQRKETGTFQLDPVRQEVLLKFARQSVPVRTTYRLEGDRLRLTLPGPADDPGEIGARALSTNNLKQLGMAAIQYADTYGALPTPAITGKGGPLLSWRVALLPYVEQGELYKQFRLDEPWDSEHNKKLIAKMPKVFATPGAKAPEGQTNYRAFTGPGTALDAGKGGEGVKLAEILDGTANTLLFVEAAEPVVWTKPDDLTIPAKGQLPKLGVTADRVHVVFCDVHTAALATPVKDDTLRGLVTRNGGEKVAVPVLMPARSDDGQLVLECVRRGANPADPQPVVLRKFDPAKDKPTPLWADAKPVTVEGGAWRVENATDNGNFKVLFDTLLDDLPKTGVIVFRAKVKTKAGGKLTWGGLQLGVGDPKFHQYDWPAHLGEYRGDVPEWTAKEVRYPARVFHEKNPPSIPVYVGLNGKGVVWVKDAEVLHIPEGAKPLPPRASKEPVKLRAFDPATDTPQFGPNSDVMSVTVEDGGWRVESGTAGVKGFHMIFGSITDDVPTGGLVVLRMKVKAKANDKLSWGRILLNFTDPKFHQYDWPEDRGVYRGDVPEWTAKEIRIPAAAFHKKDPPTLTASADYSDGVLWVKDVEVWHAPDGAKLGVARPADPPKVPEDVAELKKEVAAREKARDHAKERVDAQVANKRELFAAEAELIEARVKLAEAEGKADEAAGLLEKLVDQRKQDREFVAGRVNAGMDRPAVLDAADARLADAKARLAKVRPPK